MKRRDFLFVAGATSLPRGAKHQSQTSPASPAKPQTAIYVSNLGNDRYTGTKDRPFASLLKAQQRVRELKQKVREQIDVLVREGTYYMREPLTLSAVDSGALGAAITYSAYPGERVTISGGRRLKCVWQDYRDGIKMCVLPEVRSGELDFTQLFVNGKRQVRARYPNEDSSVPGKTGYVLAAGEIGQHISDPNPGPNDDMSFSGAAPRGIVFDKDNFTQKRWAHPEEAIIHIFQAAYWGNLEWRIKAIDYENRYVWFGEGGYQIGAKWDRHPARVNERSRFYIENVFEELDSLREWYLEKRTGTLYYMPETDVDLSTAVIEVPVLEHVINFSGTERDPVTHVHVNGFRIAHTASTFLKPYEVTSLSDWSIHRGGSIFFQGARDCTIKNCWFDAIGGNGVFMSRYNRDNVVSGCKFTETGDSAICFVGDFARANGTLREFPYECRAENNLIHDCGIFGKQIAGVYISRAKRITASHNLIYNMPRAGICIGDGTWGGHIVEYNHIHHTVRETSDHGPLNAWGRERQWSLAQSHGTYTVDHSLDAWDVLVDAMEPVIVRHNLFEEKSGWGLDLDDGASNYDIYNNISIGVSMKLREGAYRKVHNNIWYNSRVAVAIHTGNENNHDRYFRNITVMADDDMYSFIAPPARGPWMEEVDYNCFFKQDGIFSSRVSELRGESGPSREVQHYTFDEWQSLGFDKHSVVADPLFEDANEKNFRVRLESPALKLGFQNFEMGVWGLRAEFPHEWRD
jgi:Right handed beta helix region